MSSDRSLRFSPYMEFVKLSPAAKFNLATSAVKDYPLRDLPVGIEDLEISGGWEYGYPPLQERLARLRGVSPECIVHTQGTAMANHLAMAALFDPGDEVLIEEPAYELLVSTALYLGARVTRFERRAGDGYRIDADAVGRSITDRTRLIVLTNLHNPTSALASQEDLKQVGKIALKHGAHVLVDEVYLQAVYGCGVPSAFHLGEQFVATGSLTKAYGLGGLRCGWILARPELARRIWRLNDLFGATPVHIAELLSVIALDHLPEIAHRARQLVETNRRTLEEMLRSFEHLDFEHRDFEHRKPAVPDAGTTVFVRLTRGRVEDLCRLLASDFETGISPGRFFERPDHFRVGLGGDPGMTREALSRLAAALATWGG